MNDDLVKQAIAELRDVVRCRCMSAYTDRGLRDPSCECDSAEAVKVVADRIKALEAKCLRMQEERDRAIEWRDHDKNRAEVAEAKLSKAVETLDKLARLGNGDRYGNSHGNMIARATLAELKGTGQ